MSRIEALLRRDGPNCVWCGREPWPADRSVEHVCPRSRGGIGTAENLALACTRCNRQRRSRAVSAFAVQRSELGLRPRLGLLREAIARLAGSERRAHRDYGAKELRHFDAAVARVDPQDESGYRPGV